jgi:hypothetical protein
VTSAVTRAVTRAMPERSIQEHFRQVLEGNSQRNREFFDAEMDKLKLWVDDMKISPEREIKDLDAGFKLRKGEAKKLFSLEPRKRETPHLVSGTG